MRLYEYYAANSVALFLQLFTAAALFDPLLFSTAASPVPVYPSQGEFHSALSARFRLAVAASRTCVQRILFSTAVYCRVGRGRL